MPAHLERGVSQGGPGAAGRSCRDVPPIVTTVGAEPPHVAEWIARGH
jgi:hypothetical protein